MVIAAAVIAVPVFAEDEKKLPEWVTGPGQEKYTDDFKTAIMPPIRPGSPNPTCEDAPDDACILRALSPIHRGVPGLYEEFREDVEIVTEKFVDRIDPPRFYPLVGWAQLHHCQFRATVFYSEVCRVTYPFPYTIKRPKVEVVSIDRDHLHLAVTDYKSWIRELETIKEDLSGK
jgi:hypothetical protein